ncbi:MAG: radical SAM peptide maturase [bacterium]|nr:radical SAM peptide maturase [bacterium]
MKKMNAFTLIESKGQQQYFYDENIKSTQWCHPLLYYILKLHGRGADVARWFGSLTGDPVQIEELGTISKKEISYYYQKYILLRQSGFFSQIDTGYLNGRLSAGQVKSSLANTRQVTFEVVDYCNLECEYCTYGKFYDDFDRREQNKLDPAAAKTFLKYLVDLLDSPLNNSHGQALYIGFYGGEPLLNIPFMWEIAVYARQLKPKHNYFVFNITTNGLLLDKYMDFLVEHDFKLVISLDGNEYNNSYRVLKDGSPSFRKVLKNIDSLKRKYPEYFKHRTDFNAVFHNRNSISDVYHFFKSRFDKLPSLSELSPSGIKASMQEEFWKTYANINASLEQAEDYSLIQKDMFQRLPNINGVSQFIGQCSGFVFDDYNDLLASVHGETSKTGQTQPRIPTGTCVPFSRKVFITVNGRILPCERIGHQFHLGTADETEVDLDFDKIANYYNRYIDKLAAQCTGCANAESCMQCMFYLDLDSPAPKCSGQVNKTDFSQFLAGNISFLEDNPDTYDKIMKEVRIE